jgi:hypothetical protein
MLEVWFGVCLGLLLASSGALWYKFHTLESTINRSMNKVQESVEFPIDAIKDEISDTIQDFMSNMNVPTAQDHLLGGISQIMQMWAMKKFAPAVEMIQSQMQNENL